MKSLGVAKSRLQYYHDTGIIIPETESSGPGTARQYSVRNMAEILLAMKLTKIGVSVRTTAKIIAGLPEAEAREEKNLGRVGLIDPNEQYGAIEPGLPVASGTFYLSIEFSSNKDPDPTIYLGYQIEKTLEMTPAGTHKPDMSKSSHVVLINLTEIKHTLAPLLG